MIGSLLTSLFATLCVEVLMSQLAKVGLFFASSLFLFADYLMILIAQRRNMDF